MKIKLPGVLTALLFVTHSSCALDFSSIDFESLFEEAPGTFVLYHLEKDQQYTYNPAQAQKRLVPCSTFKIPNSLFGLDAGVLSGPEHHFEWDGEEKFFEIDGERFVVEAWNKDQTLRSAFQNSVIWCYIEIATKIGRPAMEAYLARADYGNQEIGEEFRAFWLNGELKISAYEQIQFLKRVVTDSLPFDQKHIAMLKDIMIVEQGDEYVLRGKTGSGYRTGYAWGWYVGYVEHEGQTYIFASNVENEKSAGGRMARAITFEVLGQLGLREASTLSP